MLLVLVGASSVSFAASPDYWPCNYTYYITYYDSPSNAGTINGYSNGQTQTIQRNNVPCGNSAYYGSGQASPSNGYLFSSWTSTASLSSTTANPTSFIMGPGSVSITAHYVPLPDILGLLSYSCSGCSSSSGSTPSSTTNNSSPSTSSGFSFSSTCGVINNNKFKDPYCLWVGTGRINGKNYVSLLFEDDSSACCDVSPWNYPSGNTTVSMTLQLVDSTHAIPTGMSTNFVPASGSPVNLGNSFQENYGTHLWSSVNELAGYESADAQAGYLPYCGTNNAYCTLGMAYKVTSVAVADLVNVLLHSGLTSSFL